MTFLFFSESRFIPSHDCPFSSNHSHDCLILLHIAQVDFGVVHAFCNWMEKKLREEAHS
jgi:hypothetical protein